MTVGLRLNGHAIGIDPASTPDTTDRNGTPIWGFPVYANRSEVNAWELCELQPQGTSQFSARFLATNRQLTMTPDGRLESRPAGAIGPYEVFFATSQPDGSAFLYRFEGTVLVGVLTIEDHS